MTNLDLSITEQMDYETFVKIISNIPSCIFFKDTELKYRFSSHCWAQLISDDIVGKTDLDIRKDKENAMKAMEADQVMIESGKGCEYIIKSDIDGDISYLQLIKEPVSDENGRVLGIVGLINDVTEKTIMEKKIVGMSEMLEVQCKELENSNQELKATLEKVEKMHKAQKLFTASMNHELRSPLNGIIGTLQLLMEDETLGSEQKTSIKNAYISSQLMLEIVNELLDFAKLEMSEFTIKNEKFLMSTVLDNIEFMGKTQAKDKGLQFTLKREASVPEVLVGDEKRIMQILHNFVSNAIKYTLEGSVLLQISYENEKLIIVCSDTGQGMEEEAMKHLFEPFVRLNEQKNKYIQGTGLGLSVVKKIIDKMNGEITVSSKVGEGSVFTARIPVATKDKTAEGLATGEQNRNKTLDFGKLKVLCVDDSKVNAMVMASLLSKMGVATEVCYSAGDALKKADEKKYDIIFMDHMMPETDGLEAFGMLREKSVLNSRTPVVMLTGNVEDSYVELYKNMGINGYLSKPVLKESMMNMIYQVMDIS